MATTLKLSRLRQHIVMSNSGNQKIVMEEFWRRKKIQALKCRRWFLQQCIDEQVLPKTAPKQLKELEHHPFPASARAYLTEAKDSVSGQIEVLSSNLQGIHLPHNLVSKLKQCNQWHNDSLQRNLASCCSNSAWSRVGCNSLVTNISSKVLSETQHQALSFGLKFDTGKDERPLSYFMTKAGMHKTSDLNKGFAQGVITTMNCLKNEQFPALPRRYEKALNDMKKDSSVHITQADKGGGVVVMDSSSYTEKMIELLEDETTYTARQQGFAEKQGMAFNQSMRRLLRRSEKGKQLQHLLEEKPRCPSMYGLPKMHKEGIPMRPITSGIGSAPHRIAKVLARPLSDLLGTISGAHLKNSSDLIERLKKTGFRNKTMVSFDVKSLFTNVPTNAALAAINETVQQVDEEKLPLPKQDYLQALHLCVNFNVFEFQGNEFQQQAGLAMGSPLSPVLACLYMETLEKRHYQGIIGRHNTWLRYVDDVLVITNKRTVLTHVLHKLNEVEKSIQFTMEQEDDSKLPFLDTLIIRTNSGPRFKVYRKKTNKDDFLHFFSAHSKRTKSGVALGFFSSSNKSV